MTRAYNRFTTNPRGAADREWMKDAACTNPNIDPKIFFPEIPKGANERQRRKAIVEARKICWGLEFMLKREGEPACKCTKQCLQYAIDMDCRFGIWGGISEENRPHGGAA